jgi:phosphoserine aminotransferase
MLGLVLEWVESLGGLPAMEKINNDKAKDLYDAIDGSGGFYRCPNEPASRSKMNVVFRVKGNDEALEEAMAKEAKAAGLVGIKGHRSAGGMRASIYNAMPREGVQALVGFMKEFQKKHG